MSNVELHPPKRLPAFRKIAIGTWATTYDPQVYGTMVVRMERALEYIDTFRQKTGRRLTVTHLVAKLVAVALERTPDANALLRLGRIYLRKHISVFLQVVMTDPITGKPDLSGVTLHDIDRMKLEEIVDATEVQVAKVRKDEDEALSRSRGLFSSIPGFILHRVLRFLSFILYSLNLDLGFLGVPRDGFGSIMVTNIGSLGLEQAYAPLVPWSRVPMVVAVGKVADEPVVDGDRVVPGKVMRLCATFDHRLLDGAHAAALSRCVHEAFDDPEKFFGPVLGDRSGR
jgi:pyruvate/2-oxoglutarate dehydrogenase complex dihydrolipoamide acyltransferase (E2) component